MPYGRVSSGRSHRSPAASRALRNRKRISCCPACVATGRAPRNHLVRLFVVRTVVASSHRPKPASFRCCHTPNMFRPRGFSPPRRFTPHPRSQACCILIPEGVRRVSTRGLRLPRLPDPKTRDPSHPVIRVLSRNAFHTPRRSPPTCSSLPCDSFRSHHCDRCLLAVVPSAARWIAPAAFPTTLDLEALLCGWVRSDRLPLPAGCRPLLPWAWFPSRVLARFDFDDPRRLRLGPLRLSRRARCNIAAAAARPLRRPRTCLDFARTPSLPRLPSGWDSLLPGWPSDSETSGRSVCCLTRARSTEVARSRPAAADPLGVLDVKELA
jgi:hypothetical protein